MSQIYNTRMRTAASTKHPVISVDERKDQSFLGRWLLTLVVTASLAIALLPRHAIAQSLISPSLTATAYSKTQVNLAWNDPNQAVQGAGYVVERAKGSPNTFVPAYTSTPNVTNWADVQLAPGVTYYFRVRAFTVAAGVTNYSAYTSIASATTQSSAYPDAPNNLIAAPSDSTQIKLSWQNKATNASEYHVQQLNPGSGAWSVIGTTTSTKNYYIVTGLLPSSVNTFRVTAWNASGESPPSNTVAATTKSETTPPAGTLAINGGAAFTASSQVNVNLAATDTTGVTGYFISTSSAAPAAGAFGWVAVTPTTSYLVTVPFTLSTGDGSKTLFAWYKDGGGNVSPTASASINLDQTAPVSGSLLTTVSGTQISLSWAGFSDAGSGVNPSSYKLVFSTTGSPAANCATGTVLAGGAANTFVHLGLSVGTTYYYRACASDNVGNVATGATATGTLTVLGSGPSGSMVINGNAPFTNSLNVTANLSASAGAGINGYWLSFSSTPPFATDTGWVAVIPTTSFSASVPYTLVFTTDGTKSLFAWFKDVAGNVSAVSSDTIVLDRTTPNNGTLTANGSLAQVALTWAGFSDVGSGIASYTLIHSTTSLPANCSSGTTLYSGPGTSFTQSNLLGGSANYYRVCATDGAGNVSSGATATASAMGNSPPIAKAGPDQTGTTGTPIYFDASGSSDTDGSIVSYALAFGDGFSVSSANAAVVSHTYSAAGTYTMTLTVTDNLGATATDSALVTVKTPQTAQGTFSSVKQFGGASSDVGYSVTVDKLGNTIIAGTFQGTVDFGGGTLTSAGLQDIFIAKFSSTGAHVCSLAIGGAGDDSVSSVATDSSGNIFIAGSFTGTVNFGGPILVSDSASMDGFAAKYSSTCGTTAQWARKFGFAGSDTSYGIAVDINGDALLTGYFTLAADFGGGTVLGGTLSDLFVAKYSGSSGAYVWAKTISGAGTDFGRSIATDGDGNVVVAGGYRLTLSDSTHVNLLTSAGSVDAFVIKYSPSGTLLWARSIGGIGDDTAYGVAVDAGGNIVVTGSFEHTISVGGASLTAIGASDGFLAKFSPMGTYLWSTRIGGSDSDMALAVATDGFGSIVVTGASQNAGQWDTFIQKFSSSGTVLWSKTLIGAADDVGYGIATDANSNVFVTGYFRGTTDFGGGPISSAGVEDVFLLKLAP